MAAQQLVRVERVTDSGVRYLTKVPANQVTAADKEAGEKEASSPNKARRSAPNRARRPAPNKAVDPAADDFDVAKHNVKDLVAYVGDDQEKAAAILAAEQDRGDDARPSLVEKLASIVDPDGE